MTGPMRSSPALRFRDLSVEIGRAPVLKSITADLPTGAFVGVCGPNGAGKTTLLRAALGLLAPSSGEALLFDRPAARLGPAERARYAAYLPQERRVAWGMSALAVAALGAIDRPPEEAEARAIEALEAVGMKALAERSVFELSGGERARVLLARLLASKAPLLLLDEPIAGLDPDAQLMTLELLKDLTTRGVTVVATLHDLCLCARFADVALVLDRGCLAACAPPLEALCPPLLAKVFRLEAEWLDTPRGQWLATARAR
jgi:iron complex transport system ATP-binding protein